MSNIFLDAFQPRQLLRKCTSHSSSNRFRVEDQLWLVARSARELLCSLASSVPFSRSDSQSSWPKASKCFTKRREGIGRIVDFHPNCSLEPPKGTRTFVQNLLQSCKRMFSMRYCIHIKLRICCTALFAQILHRMGSRKGVFFVGHLCSWHGFSCVIFIGLEGKAEREQASSGSANLYWKSR